MLGRVYVVLVFALILAALPVAGEFIVNEATIVKESSENLYIAGGTIKISGPVKGDIVTAGGELT